MEIALILALLLLIAAPYMVSPIFWWVYHRDGGKLKFRDWFKAWIRRI